MLIVPTPPTNLPNSRKKEKLTAAFCYLGPLIIIAVPFVKSNNFVRFHIRQAITMIGFNFILIAGFLIPEVGWYVLIISIFIALGLIGHGTINALTGIEKGPPITNYFANKIFKQNITISKPQEKAGILIKILRIILLIILWSFLVLILTIGWNRLNYSGNNFNFFGKDISPPSPTR